MMTNLDDAMKLASLGWPVFPCERDKTPVGEIVDRGHLDATTHPRRIQTWWKIRPDALVGVAIPKGTIALDVDDVEAFSGTGFPLDGLPGQQTPRGGYHRFARADHDVRQTIKRIPGLDTRVGGKGYVIAWQPAAFPPVDELPGAPQWVYDQLGAAAQEKRIEGVSSSDADLLLGADGATHREDLINYAGRLRWAGATTNEIYLALVQAQQDGRIVDGKPEDPWTEENFKQIAADIGSKKGPDKAPILQITKVKHAVPAQDDRDIDRIFVSDLLNEELPELQFVVEEFMPEGVGIIAAPPKSGKSFLMLQTCIEVVSGGTLFGRKAKRRPVLYYALEDGRRRIQRRTAQMLRGRNLDLSMFEARLTARPLGDGFEADIIKWLDDNEENGPGLVIIDVYAKVRRASKGKDNAYNEDYSSLSPLVDITKARPGTCVIVVTHTRKAGSDDFMSTVQGTHGVVGSADWVWALKRERMKAEAILDISGRDVTEIQLNLAHAATGEWVLTDGPAQAAETPDQQVVLDLLLTDGDMVVMELVDLIFQDDEEDVKQNVRRKSIHNFLLKLQEQGLATVVGRSGTAKIWHAVTQAEAQAKVADVKARSARVTPAGAVGVRKVRQVRAE